MMNINSHLTQWHISKIHFCKVASQTRRLVGHIHAWNQPTLDLNSLTYTCNPSTQRFNGKFPGEPQLVRCPGPLDFHSPKFVPKLDILWQAKTLLLNIIQPSLTWISSLSSSFYLHHRTMHSRRLKLKIITLMRNIYDKFMKNNNISA